MVIQIKDVAEIFSGFAFSSEELVNKGIPVLKIGNIQNHKIFPDTDSFYNNEISKKLEKYRLLKDDFLVAMTGAGSVGRAGKMPKNESGLFLVNQRVAIVRPKHNVDPNFLFYYFTMSHVEKYLYSLGIGAGQPNISANDMLKTKVDFPDIKTQQKIAGILSKYDEAIENNNKRIKLLEQMAQNLYKEWFVRFRFPGWQNAEFENGIPKGWKVEKLEDFCFITDGTHDTPKQVEDGVPLVTGKAVIDRAIDFSVPYNISFEDHEKIKRRSGLETGDILFSNIGTVGNCCLVDYDREFSVKNMIILKPQSEVKSQYLFQLLINDTMQNLFKNQTNGSSQQFIGLDFMRKFKILIPSEEVLKLFAKFEIKCTKLIVKLRQQTQNLSRQRDLLLPRLMSGKLQVLLDTQ